LALEFTLLNYEPRPWRVRDSILAGLQMYRTLTTSWRDELNKLHMRTRGDADKVEFLFPVRSGFDPQPGSNAWALSGSRTATGKAILANDPHLDFAVPSTWYLVHLQAPGLNVSGASLPGVPGVIVGHNDRIAWGVTNLQFDVQDLFREQFDPQTARYVFQGQTLPAVVERELIPVKGEKPSEFAIFVTRHGPVVAIEDNNYYSLQWTAADAASFTFPFLELNRAGNWTEFTAAIARFPGPGQNFVYADVEGNIGYHATGHLPIRKNCKGDVPADGASGECEWQGYIPFDQLPQVFNPASGAVVTANQNPFPEEFEYTVSGNFAAPYRARRIQELLETRPKWNAAEMLTVQKDVYSAFTHFLAKQVVAAWDARKATNPELQEAVALLRGWSGIMEKGAAAPMLVALIYQELRKTVAERASPGAGQTYEFQMATAALERLLGDRPSGWFPDYDAMLMKCFSDAAAAGAKIQGSKISRWDYGKYNELRIVHPVGNALPLVGSSFNIGPVPMSGSSTTVKQTTRRLGPSMRMIVDLGDWERSLQNLTIGESAHRLSSHYKDQWDAYYAGTSFPMQFGKIEGKSVLVVNPR
jgi:penicillin amidase